MFNIHFFENNKIDLAYLVGGRKMNKLSAKHFILFVFGVTYISFKTYPSLFIKEGGRDTWLYTLIIYLIFFAFAMYLIYVMDSRKVYNINDIFTQSMPKPLGNIFLFLFSFGLFLAALESASVEANVVKSCFFLGTPSWYIIFFFILPLIFLIGKSIRSFLIFIIILISSLGVNTLILSIITEKYKDIKYIMPVFSGNVISEFLSTFLLVLGSLSAFVISLPYLRYLNTGKNLRKHSFIAFGILGALCVYILIGILSTFGPLRAANLFYPEFVQSQRVQLCGFLEFGDFFFLYQTVAGFFLKYAIATYGIYIIYKNHIKNHKYFITVYTLAIFIFGTFLSRNNYILFNILKYYQYINLVLFIAIPLIVFTTFALKYKKK